MGHTAPLRLTAAALFCRALGCFPVWLLILWLYPQAQILPAMAVLLLLPLLSSAVCRFLRLHYRASPRRGTVLAWLTAIPAALLCGYLVCRFTGAVILPCIAAAVTMILTHFRIDAEPDMLFTTGAYTAFLTGIFMTAFLLRIAEIQVPMKLILAVTGILSAAYFLMRNQFMLLRLVNRRSNAGTDVPQEIRRGNLLLAGAVILLPALLMIFWEPLTGLLIRMQDALSWLAGRIIDGITRLIAWLGGNAPELPPDAANEMTEQQLPEPGGFNPLALLLWIPIIAAAVFMWWVLLSDWFYDLRILMRRFLRRLRGGADAEDTGSRNADAEYYDVETVTEPAEKPRQQKRLWNRALRRWEKLPDGDEKFYAGFRLLLTAPCWTEGELRGSDTVREICGKWMQGHQPENALDAAAADYHAGRYAGTGLPAEALRDMAAALAAARERR